MKWLSQKWVCILFLVLFPPVGMYLLWKYREDWKKNLKIGVTVISAIWCIALLCSGFGHAAPEEIKLLDSEIKIGIGKTVDVEIELTPQNADFSKLVIWSSKEDVVVSSLEQRNEDLYCCKVQAKQEGDVQLMVYCDKVQSNTITIHVLDYDKLKKQAATAEQAIVQIGEVTLQSGEAILIARQAYDALGEDAVALVSNYGDLLAAEQALQQLQEEAWRQAEEAQSRIDAIGEAGLESEDAITAAREYYNGLPEAVRPLVKNYQALEQAERLLEQKKEEEAQVTEEPGKPKPSSPAIQEPEPSRPSDSGKIVYWVPKGKKYHTTKGCATLARSKKIYSGTISQAGGRDLCKVCG